MPNLENEHREDRQSAYLRLNTEQLTTEALKDGRLPTLVKWMRASAIRIAFQADRISKACELGQLAVDDPEVVTSSALLHLTAIRINASLIRSGAGGNTYQPGHYHGDSPIDTISAQIALPDLIENHGDRLTNKQFEEITAELQALQAERSEIFPDDDIMSE